jgi:hypothetical protein
MLSKRSRRNPAPVVIAIVVLTACALHAHAQAALLLEEPYGFYGAVNPTGHAALYLERVCAETPLKLRRCSPGEMGVVISRYRGIKNYDWVAIPFLPYLYAVENASEVPMRGDRQTVDELRSRYREDHLMSLGETLQPGDMIHAGWAQLVGAAYERRIYAVRFDTTPEQDDALIAVFNESPNRSHFEVFYNNCADFTRFILNTYFPGRFRRSIFPDAGITSPKQLTAKLVRYARKHPELELAVYEIPQVPGYRRLSRSTDGVAEALITNGYAIPIALLNPYLAGGLLVDYLAAGASHPIPRHPDILDPGTLTALTAAPHYPQNPDSADFGPPAPQTTALLKGKQP